MLISPNQGLIIPTSNNVVSSLNTSLLEAIIIGRMLDKPVFEHTVVIGMHIISFLQRPHQALLRLFPAVPIVYRSGQGDFGIMVSGMVKVAESTVVRPCQRHARSHRYSGLNSQWLTLQVS